MKRRSSSLSQVLLAALLVCRTAGAEPSVLDAKSSIDNVLDALHDSGRSLKTLTATLKTTDTDTNMGTDTFHNGQLAMRIKPGGDAQLHLILKDRQFGTQKPVADRKEYVLDNGWVTDRDFTTSKESRRQISRPGQKVDVFQLGKGPIPLPIGQDKTEVKARFDVTITPPDKDDPANAIHLALTPKPNTEYSDKYKVIDVWVDSKTRMPARVATLDQKGSIEKTFDLTDLKINPEIPDAEFRLPPLDPAWQSHDEPMQD